MNAFAIARYEAALARLNNVLEILEEESDLRIFPRLSLLSVRGDLVAMRQLLEMEATLRDEGAADTERPSTLRVVK